jgi:hypothetical protein
MQNKISKEKIQLAEKLVYNIMNGNKKGINKCLETMVNNRISAKIRKVAQTEDLI